MFSLSVESQQVLAAFGLYLIGVMALGIFSHRYLSRGSFIKEYFLGNRGLGPWVLALSIAATAVSGGTFMGFPSLIYSNGWVMALWIAGYMMVPLTTMALFGKRINQVSRISGSVTVPDVFRDRFRDPLLGATATLIILVCLTVNLVAQFKGGGLVMREALRLPVTQVNLGLLSVDRGYLVGLAIFAVTVIAYTAYGGFWAVTWTDVLEGLVMLFGVILLAVLAIRAVPSIDGKFGLEAATVRLQQQDPQLVTPPGPRNFLPLGLAFTFFLQWSMIGAGQPGGMVRLMAFRDSASYRRAILLVCGYYVVTYLSLIIVFVCARALYPTEYLKDIGTEGQPDSIMPVMVRRVAPSPFVAGLLMAAPYAAIMSTVAAFLLLISSGLVRDIYQRFINPKASGPTLRILSIGVTAGVGFVVSVAALRPPPFLQYIIVLSTAGLGCAFLVPMALTIYWRRATRQGVWAGMVGGFATLVGLYVLGWLNPNGIERADPLAPYTLFGLDPQVWGIAVSALLGVGISRVTTVDPVQAKVYFP
jgi:SSS family transporter